MVISGVSALQLAAIITDSLFTVSCIIAVVGLTNEFWLKAGTVLYARRGRFPETEIVPTAQFD